MEAEDKNTSGETCWAGLQTSRQSLLFSDIPAPAWLAIFVTQHSYTQSETSRSGDGRIEDLTRCLQEFGCSGRVFFDQELFGRIVCNESYSKGCALHFCESLKVRMQTQISQHFDFFLRIKLMYAGPKYLIFALKSPVCRL